MLPIIKVLTSAGTGSRRKMTDAIKTGRVAVNGKMVESFIHPVNPESDRVTINGKNVLARTKGMTYLMLNKPKGIVSSTRDEMNRTTVLDILPGKYRELRLYPVGRLDKDSTGLILLTNDGELTNRLTHPRFEQEKEYLLQIEERLKPGDRNILERGMELEEGMTHAARVKPVNIPPYNYAIIIHEGKKRQIRRMFINLGYRVLELKRIRIGSLRLGTLPEGQIRELTPAELKK